MLLLILMHASRSVISTSAIKKRGVLNVTGKVIEKKVGIKTAAIALGIACIVLVAGLAGAIANYTTIISGKDNVIASKDSEIAAKNSQIADRDTTISSLNAQIASKDSQISSSNSQIASLQDQISNINNTLFQAPTTREQAFRAFDKTESLAARSIVIESFDFGPSTQAENYPQARAHLLHARELGLRVVALAFWPSGVPIGEEILREVYGIDFPDIPGYGTEVVYLGYVPGNEVGMQTFGDDTATAKIFDHYGTPVGDLPLMQECQNAEDFDLWAEWASGVPGEQQVILFVQSRHGGPSALPLIVGATAANYEVMLPFYSSGQIYGILNGQAGAGIYELLLNVKYGHP